MDMKDLKGPSAVKAPQFTLTSEKTGRKTIVSAVPLMAKADAMAAAKAATSVTSRQMFYTALIVASILENPQEMKSKPDTKNRAGEIFEELENDIFGKDELRDGQWRMLKSRYLGYYRQFGDPTVEKDGVRFAKPLRVLQTEMDNMKPDPAGDGDRLVKAVETAIARGVKREYVESAMQMLGAFRDTLLQIEQGSVPTPEEGESEFTIVKKAREAEKQTVK